MWSLGIVSLAFAVGIVRTLLASIPCRSRWRGGRPAPYPSRPPVGADSGRGIQVIAAQNLFNPARSETATAAAVAVRQAHTHGIVIDGPMSRAFLEDPAVKRVGGYSLGDSVSGGKDTEDR